MRSLRPHLSVAVASAVLVAGVVLAFDVDAEARAFATELTTGKYDACVARFDAACAKALPAAKLEATWKQVQGQAGDFVAIKGSRASGGIALVTLELKKSSLDLKLAYDKTGKVAGIFFVPTTPPWAKPNYADPSRFTEEAATVSSGALALPGTLTLPKVEAGARVPALILVHGSGPNDADETIGPNKVFKDLAWGLASEGVAALRYVKRTKAHPASFAGRFTVREEVTDDARAAVAQLAQDPRIDPKRIFVLGHSMGGWLAPRIAAEEPRVAGIVVLAGNTRPLEELVIDQLEYLGAPEKSIAAAREAAKKIQGPDLAKDATVDFLGSPTPAAYFLDVRGYDPAAVAAKLERPVLVLQGERDYQVRLADYEGWKKTLEGRPGARLKLYPGLNHLFMAGTGRSMPAEYERPGHVATDVVAEIGAFVLGK